MGYIYLEKDTPISTITERGVALEIVREVKELAGEFEADIYSCNREESENIMLGLFLSALEDIYKRYTFVIERLYATPAMKNERSIP